MRAAWNRVAAKPGARRENLLSSYVLEQGIDRARGRVHSVFARSLNVELDGFLLHLGDARDPLSCCGAALAPDLLGKMLAQSRPGDRALVKQGVLKVCGAAGLWGLDLRALAPRSLSVAKPLAIESLLALERPLAAMEVERSIGLERSRGLARSLRALGQRDPGEGELHGAVGYLLGRGLGLTPSGDDLLVGYGIARWLLGRAARFVRAVREQLAGQTTDVSASYLRAMADGFANQGYCDLARAAAQGRRERFAGLLGELQRVGHTSGSDGLLGFLTGLRSMAPAAEGRKAARAGDRWQGSAN